MRRIGLVAVIAACHGGSTPHANVDPVTDAEARTFADTLLATVTPTCEIAKIDPLVDHAALAAKFAERSTMPGLRTNLSAEVFERRHSGARILCTWLGAQMRVLSIAPGGQPTVRKLIKEPGAKAESVGYYRLELGRSRDDGIVRIVDAYSYLQGAWLTEILTQTVETARDDGVMASMNLGATMKDIVALLAAKKPSEALAKFEQLSPAIRQLRYMQIMRVNIAKGVSPEAYRAALDDLDRAFPNDPAVSMVEIDGAVFRGNLAGALHDIDIVDHEVGGDPFQDAVRSTLYLRMHDNVSAEARAAAAIAAEPTLPRGYLARFDVLIANEDWPRAVETMDALARLHTPITDAGLRASHTYDAFVASPEYTAWHAQH